MFLKMEAESASEAPCFVKTVDDGQGPKTRRLYRSSVVLKVCMSVVNPADKLTCLCERKELALAVR
jgi:hypothetical protein